MRDEVRAAFPAEVSRFEGRCNFLYLDTKGLATTGVGNLVDPISLALELPWLLEDGSSATEDEVRVEWERVKGMRPGLVASRYRNPDGVHLTDGAIDGLVGSKRDEFWRVLVARFPGAEEWPAPAQMGILLMAWALGPWFYRHWPKFSAACDAMDWRKAASECRISKARDVRNDEHRRLFLQAAEVLP